MSVKISATQPPQKKRIIPLSKIPTIPGYEWLTVPALRHHIFQSEPRIASNGDVIEGNGLKEAGAIIRLNRKILIDLDKFDEWIESHREA